MSCLLSLYWVCRFICLVWLQEAALEDVFHSACIPCTLHTKHTSYFTLILCFNRLKYCSIKIYGKELSLDWPRMRTFIAVLLAAFSAAAIPQFKPSMTSLSDTPVPTLVADEDQGEYGNYDMSGNESEDQQSESPTEPTPTTPESSAATEEPEANDLNAPTITPTASRKSIPTVSSHGVILSRPSSNITYTTQSPTSTPKSLIPHWSYKKSSIAAASIFTSIALAALIFLIVVYIRRLKRVWRRRKLERQKRIASVYSSIPLTEDPNPTHSDPKIFTESKSDRDSLIFSNRSRSHSPSMGFKFDDDRTPTPRSYRMNTTGRPVALEQMESRSSSNRAQSVLAPVNLATLDREYDPHLLSSQRRESLAKPIVVVRPSLNPIVPMSASTASMSDDRVALHNPHVAPKTAQNQRRSTESGGSSKSAESNRLTLLPSIQRSSSPIFRFSEG